MKKNILIVCFLLSIIVGFAQKQANIWYFGNRSGLDFNQVPPIALNNGQANSQEGSAVMSDINGKLLFYTNGVTILNRKHLIMPNGSGLRGDLSSTNNTVFIPMPGNDSIYYLFTIGSAREEVPVFSYSVIDMKADAGFGAVIEKNVLIEDTCLEKLAAIRHCNNRDAWVVIHKWNTDEYHSYLLTGAGLNSVPVISRTGLRITGQINNAIGTLKFSTKGNKLVALHSFDNDAVELLDFDNTTGVISNPQVFQPNAVPHQPTFTGVYGAEFSPDGKLLYVSSNNSPSDPTTLYQFDITSNNAVIILSTKQIIAQITPWYAGALQIGTDRKIYMAMWNDTSISVIDDPDIYGPGCNFNFNKIYLGPTNGFPSQFGLPNFMQSYFDTASNPYDFTRLGNCLDKNITFLINRTNGIDSVKWDFGDFQQSQQIQPTHSYVNAGFYDVKLIVYKVDCSGLNDTINRRIWIADSSNFLGADTASCNALSLVIGVDEIYGVNYLWNTGFTGNKITTTGFGLYWMEMEQNGCKLRDSINVSAKPKPTVDLGPDSTICKYKPIVLTTGTTSYSNYLWSTGETTTSILVDKPGIYSITVSQSGCTAADTIQILPGDCNVFIPSAFTPNDDGLNETFGVITDVAVKNFSMQVFNKWGQMVFNSSDITQKWNGTFKGKKVPNGAYPWILYYVTGTGTRKYQQGTVMLIR